MANKSNKKSRKTKDRKTRGRKTRGRKIKGGADNGQMFLNPTFNNIIMPDERYYSKRFNISYTDKNNEQIQTTGTLLHNGFFVLDGDRVSLVGLKNLKLTLID